MSERTLLRRHMLSAALIGLATVFIAVGDVRAGTLIINITDGTTSYDIFDQIPPDVNFNLNQIEADPTTLLFPDFNIVGLTASSNNPGANDPDGALLTVGGHVQRITGGGPATLTITAYQTDYALPSVPIANLTSGTSSTFSNVPGGSIQTFQSWYNPTSPATPPPPFGIPAPLIVLPLAGTNGLGGNTMLGGLPGSSSFSLTDQIVLTIGGATGTARPDVVFGGTTQVHLQAIPEPSSVLLLAIAAPTALLVVRRVRRVHEQSAA
jgi:hypothetical protein